TASVETQRRFVRGLFGERKLDHRLLPWAAAQQDGERSRSGSLEKTWAGLQEDRSGLGCRALLVCKVALPDRRLDRLSFQIEPHAWMGRPGCPCQAVHLGQRWLSTFWLTAAAERSADAANEETKSGPADCRIRRAHDFTNIRQERARSTGRFDIAVR